MSKKTFGLPPISESNCIYLLQNCFSNHAYFKDMYITLKEIGNICIVCIGFRILLICKFLNFTAVPTTKNKRFQSFHTIFCMRKLFQFNSFHLHIWTTARHEPEAIETRAQNFNLKQITRHKLANLITFLNLKYH